MNTAVEIHDLNCDPPRIYICKCREDAKDSTDASVYDEVLRHRETITMGLVIGCPFEFKQDAAISDQLDAEERTTHSPADLF